MDYSIAHRNRALVNRTEIGKPCSRLLFFFFGRKIDKQKLAQHKNPASTSAQILCDQGKPQLKCQPKKAGQPSACQPSPKQTQPTGGGPTQRVDPCTSQSFRLFSSSAPRFRWPQPCPRQRPHCCVVTFHPCRSHRILLETSSIAHAFNNSTTCQQRLRRQQQQLRNSGRPSQPAMDRSLDEILAERQVSPRLARQPTRPICFNL